MDVICPGCNNPVSQQEQLTGRCAKDGQPLDAGRIEIHLFVPPTTETGDITS